MISKALAKVDTRMKFLNVKCYRAVVPNLLRTSEEFESIIYDDRAKKSPCSDTKPNAGGSQASGRAGRRGRLGLTQHTTRVLLLLPLGTLGRWFGGPLF